MPELDPPTYDKARRIFQAWELSPMRVRLLGIGAPAAEVERKLYALTVEMRRLNNLRTGTQREHRA